MGELDQLRERIAIRISAVDHLIEECPEGSLFLIELLSRRSEMFAILHDLHEVRTQSTLAKRKK